MLNKKIIFIIFESALLIVLIFFVYGLQKSQEVTTTTSTLLKNDQQAYVIQDFYKNQIEQFNQYLNFYNAKKITNNTTVPVNYNKNLQLSIHKFAATELKYNPYLPIKILKTKIDQLFDISNFTYTIEILDQLPNNLKRLYFINYNDIQIINNLTISKTIHNEYILISYKFQNMQHIQEKFQFNFHTYNHPLVEEEKQLTKNTTLSTHLLLDEKYKVVLMFLVICLALYRIVKLFYKDNTQDKILEQFFHNSDIDLEETNLKPLLLKILQQSKERKITLEKTITTEAKITKQFEQFIEDSAHQLNTPLTTIELNINLMEMIMGDIPQKDQYIENIKVSIELLKLYNNELAYIASDKTTYKPSYFNSSEVLYSRKQLFELIEKISSKKIIFQIESQIILFINQQEFELLVNNNLITLLKISKQNTSITISFTKSKTKASLIFSAEEYDNTINKEIFENYYRESNNERKTGTGLYLSKEICLKNNIEFSISDINKTNLFEYHFNLTSI